ncbi:HEAT repeat domain-containing protein [Oscillatoria sp. FACHB-1407]|uniref:HEAT repeat domain-containing protein n=1 Tax=Oscillatoria sp. FACHB-1407 TaxID=2692847 RepID=UPI001685CB81|nr:HEAT repeat domain-containing protein [Oscillatoria sp. FACHB-1407]MBD2464476.1 HEAT repeat domain-containing protein [Oscillatoria sp. FACHB-1407]
MADPIDFQPYLDSIGRHYTEWWNLGTLTDISNSQSPLFDFEQTVQLVKPKQSVGEASIQEAPKLLTLQQLWEDSIRAREHVLLIGRPGAGKSTVLKRLLVYASEQARQDPLLQDTQTKIPVLVELELYPTHRRSDSGILDLIEDFLVNNECPLDISSIRRLIAANRLLLLIDGVNELPKDALTDLRTFQRKPLSIVFTTRDSDQGGLDYIKQKLELQPLSSTEVQRFIQERMPGQNGEKLKELSDRIRDLGETPLVIWMLYQVFQQTGDVPETLGEALREFTKRYERNCKAGKVITVARDLLKHLAFEMMHSEKPTDFRLVISEEDAIEVFRQFLEREQTLEPKQKAREYLENLLNHHLLQKKGKNQIGFCHQLLQEYYAAERLLEMLQQKHPDLVDDKRFQHYYLNYLKWTEAIALMLGLADVTKSQAKQLIELALATDLMLGARLVREINIGSQPDAIADVMYKLASIAPEEPIWLKLKILQKIGTKAVINYLIPLLDYPDDYISRHAYLTLMLIDSKVIPEQCRFIRDLRKYQDILKSVTETSETGEVPILHPQTVEELVLELLKAMEDLDFGACCIAVEASEKVGSETIISALLAVLSPSKSHSYNRQQVEHLCRLAAYYLRMLSLKENVAKVLDENHLQELVQVLEHSDVWIRWRVAFTLWNVASKQVIPLLLPKLNHKILDVSFSAALVLGKFGCQEAVSGLIQIMDYENLNKHPDPWEISYVAAYALGQVETNKAAKFLPELISLISKPLGENAFRAIAAIQSRCGFYNYEIYRQTQEMRELESEEGSFIKKIYQDIDRAIYQIQDNRELRQKDSEDRLTIDIVGQLLSLNYEAAHDTKIGGHVDLVVKKDDFKWLGEAKIYRDNTCLWEGFQQLVTRYSTGDSNQNHGGLIIYIFQENAKSIMDNWQIYLMSKELPDYVCKPCEMRDLAFTSSHRHESSGKPFYVRHMPVILHFAPKDKSGRRRKNRS